ncbi:MAG: hypothetical protein ACE3JN_17480 [Ectobacillus sp.]
MLIFHYRRTLSAGVAAFPTKSTNQSKSTFAFNRVLTKKEMLHV